MNNRLHLFYHYVRPFACFLTVGALSAFIQLCAFSYCWEMLKINYQLAASIAYILSVIFHYSANRRFTFKSQSHVITELKKYIAMVAINYFITLVVMHIVVVNLALSPYIGTVAAIAATVGMGYVLAKYWVFVA